MKDDLPHYPTEDELAALGINKDEVAIAITRDGQVYVGKTVPPTKLQTFVMKSRFFTTLLRWIGKADRYLLDRIWTVRAKRLRKRSGIK